MFVCLRRSHGLALAAVGAGVYVVLWNRDPVPNDIEACIREADIPLVRSTDALSPGAYVLRWQVLAIDGHITRGDIPFVVGN